MVASEPYDDDPRWTEVPDRTLLTATRTRIELFSLKEAPQDVKGHLEETSTSAPHQGDEGP